MKFILLVVVLVVIGVITTIQGVKNRREIKQDKNYYKRHDEDS